MRLKSTQAVEQLLRQSHTRPFAGRLGQYREPQSNIVVTVCLSLTHCLSITDLLIQAVGIANVAHYFFFFVAIFTI